MYKKAGQIAEFTGISSPYEVAEKLDLTLDTCGLELGDYVRLVIDKRVRRGLIKMST